MKIQTLVVLLLGAGWFSSCVSLNQSVSYSQDDIYYSNSFQHRFNQQALLMNQDVAMPDSAIEYFNESYAQTLRPNYASNFDRYENLGSDSNYTAAQTNPSAQNSQQNIETLRQNQWMNSVSMGVGIGMGYGYNAYYGGAYRPNYYNPSYYPRRYTSNPQVTQVPLNSETPFRPYISPGNNRGTNPMLSMPSATNNTNQTKPYINPNANSGDNRAYKTRTNTGNNSGVWSSPGYYNGGGASRSGGSYSGGSVSGYRRR
jgi:uncharacterized membrane protein YgcG